MTLEFFQPSSQENIGKGRYYISQFDGDTYQIVDSVENREVCVCSNYDDWEDAETRAKKLVLLLNKNETRRKVFGFQRVFSYVYRLLYNRHYLK